MVVVVLLFLEAAITLFRGFYGALAEGYPVDTALAVARKTMFAQGNDVEWGTPVLYMRVPDGGLWHMEKGGNCKWHRRDPGGMSYRPMSAAM